MSQNHHLTVSISPGVYDRVAAAAAARGVSIRWMADRLLTESLDHLRPLDDFHVSDVKEFAVTPRNGD